MEATIKLIKDPTSKILLIPDSPTGADILDEGNFAEINKSGKSKFTLRASYEINYTENTIRFTSLPLQTKSSIVIRKIIEMRKNRMFEEIIDISDSTKNGEVDILIHLKSDANPDKVLKQLFKKNTNLKMTYPVGIMVIDDYVSYDYGVKGLLLEWIEYRRDIVRSMFLNSLQIALEKQHMNKVLLMVFNKDNIETTVQIAKNSKSRKDTIEKLMAEYDITSLQAATIADMRVYNFNEDSYNRYKQEEIDLREEVDYINGMLEHDENIDKFIIGQLEEGIKKYGRPRMSKVVKENNKNDENIPDTNHLIGISASGYIKKISSNTNSSIGKVGKENGNLTVMEVNNREDILVIDSTGKVSKISVSAIPDMEFNDIGIEIGRYFSVSGKVVALMELPSLNILKTKDENLCIIFITKNGFAKKVPISEFKKISNYKIGITLNDDDEVAMAMFAFDRSLKDIVIYTNRGNGIRLPITEIKTLKKEAKGIKQIDLEDGEYVVNASKISANKKLLFYITSSGRVKLTELKYFPIMQRKDKLVPLIQLNANESLVGISSVSKNDTVMVYRKHSEPVELSLKELEISTRAAKGEKIVKTVKGDSVVAYKVFQ